MAWCAIGVMDDPKADWTLVIERHRGVGIRMLAGGRVYKPGEIGVMFQRAVALGLDGVFVNVEDQLKTVLPPDQVRTEIESALYVHQLGFRFLVGVNTVSHLYHGVDYGDLHEYPTALQMYREEPLPDLEKATVDLLQAAWDNGFRDLQPTFMVEHANPEDVAFWQGRPRSYFTGNSLGSQNWPKGWWV